MMTSSHPASIYLTRRFKVKPNGRWISVQRLHAVIIALLWSPPLPEEYGCASWKMMN